MLNRGFVMAERRQNLVSRGIKICLPRRESERRAHPLARHCEILSALETRISMLSMTFMKFIESSLCCFIPGKIIDEILHILRVVQSTPNPPRTHDLLQELRDISSMAMEHFDEHIVPSLRVADVNAKKCYSTSGSSLVSRMGRPLMPEFLRREFKAIHQHSRSHIQQLNGLKKIIGRLNVKVKRQSNMLAYQTSKLREQKRMIQEQVSNVAEMKKHLEEWDLKFADLTNELSRNREKTSESKSSQTQCEVPNTEILNNLKNITFPPLKSLYETQSHLRNDKYCPSTSLDFSQFTPSESLPRYESNIRSRSGAFRYKPGKQSTHSKIRETLSLSRNYLTGPKIRTSINEFRANLNKQSEYNAEKEAEAINRKRKVIDLIANVVDAKVPKTEDETVTSQPNDNSDSAETKTPCTSYPVKAKGKKRNVDLLEDTPNLFPSKRSAKITN